MHRLRRFPVRLAIAPAASVYAAGDLSRYGSPRPDVATSASGQPASEWSPGIWYRRSDVSRAHVIVVPSAPRVPPPAIVTGPATRLSFPVTLPAGGTVEREAAVPNWARAPSGTLGDLKVHYRLRAELALGDGATVRDEFGVRIESRRSLNQDVEGAPLAYRHHEVETWPVRYRGDWDMALHLPVLHRKARWKPCEGCSGSARTRPRGRGGYWSRCR